MNQTKLTMKNCKSIMETFLSDPLFVFAYEQVAAFFKQNEKKVIKWFFTDNPHLGNIKPIEMVMLGKTERLIDFIIACKRGDI